MLSLVRFASILLLVSLLIACGGSPDDGAATVSGQSITHGPMLGRPGAHQMGIWARTARAGEFFVRYGTSPETITDYSAPVRTKLEDDNTGWTLLTGLDAGTRYFYQVVVSKTDAAEPLHSGSFRTWPDSTELKDPDVNPTGDFNFSFEFACGNNQSGFSNAPPTYKTMLSEIAEKVDFAVLNGDWLYEENREYPAREWFGQVGIREAEAPGLVRLAPTIVGVWENYKTYLTRGEDLSAWHRRVPSYYTADDHEILNDVYGTGTAGRRNRRSVFRDIAVEAWYDYLAWSNPEGFTQPIHFGRTEYQAGSDILEDPEADFNKIDLDQAANLHVHWGTDTAGVNSTALDREPGDPNAGIYDIVERLDSTRLRVSPPFPADGEQTYSIGRRAYSKMRVSNSDIFLLDTRSHRDMHDVSNPRAPGLSMLGVEQREWLMDEMRNSDAEVFFVFSSVNFMIPHVGAPVGGEIIEVGNKDEAWTVFVEERERLIRFWDSLGKPVFVLTGDLHNSFAIKITDRVWEFASGPHTSGNHPASSEGGRPANGLFDSRGRPAEIRWSTYVRDDATSRLNRHPVYTVVQVNNVFNNPVVEGKDRWIKFPHPQIVFQYYDGWTGNLLYAESILAE